MRKLLAPVFCFMLLSASLAQADFYMWKDKDGKEFYTDELKQIPEEYREAASVVKPDAERISEGRTGIAPGSSSASFKEHRDRHGRSEEYWRKRAGNIRLKLRDQQDEYDLVVAQLEDEERKPKKSPAKRKKSASGLEKKKMKLEQDMAKTRRLLEVDLPEEARRADAYPGWLRE